MPHDTWGGDRKQQTGIPLTVIKRLPMYHRYLNDLNQKDMVRISSGELAAKMGITASQLRQDLNWFGSFGQQGYGYRVDELLREVSRILGLHRNMRMVLVGAGRLGRAIVNYENFKRRGFHIEAIFDNNPEIIGDNIEGIKVHDVAELENHLQKRPVGIGVITTPAQVAQALVDIMVRCGLKGIWNFAPVALKAPDDVVVEHVHIGESLMVLSLKMQQLKDSHCLIRHDSYGGGTDKKK